jgi:hypothetical protein
MLKRRFFVVALAASTALLGVSTSESAFAATETYTHATATPTVDTAHCSGDVCGELTSSNSTTFDIRTWVPASGFSFFGHFELQTPEHTTFNTGQATWNPGGGGHTFQVPNRNGQYCATAWERVSSTSWENIGEVCWNISV